MRAAIVGLAAALELVDVDPPVEGFEGGFCIRDGFFGVFEGVSAPSGLGLGLAHEDLLCHLGDAMISSHTLLLAKGALPRYQGWLPA